MPKPASVELSTAYDVIENTFLHRWGKKGPPAGNVNSLGEVPDSSWFENRIGVRAMTTDELVRGANTGEGPDVSRPWTVLSGKSQGITPGFTIRDGRGDVYFVKFDPPEHPHLSTAAAVISARFFHAFGYHVAEDYLTRFDPAQVQVGPEAKVSVPGGPKRRMEQKDLDEIFAKVARQSDGRIRAVASRRLPGQPLGPHKYFGTRMDDANDIVPHEDRRELRGLRVFAAWLNHDDSRSLNSFDAYVGGEPPQGHVKHYLIDFSSTLGAGSDALRRIAPQNPRAGNEYVVDGGPIFKAAVTLGLWERPWRKVRYPVHPEIGRLEADFFEPHAWKPEYPNAAFVRMQPADAFWAARIVSRFSDEDVRALVGVGEIDDAGAAAYLTQTLLRRRDKIVARYFGELNPLAGFRLDGDGLAFQNLGASRGLGTVQGYEYQWFAFDNASGALQEMGEPTRVSGERIPRPATSVPYTMVRVRTLCEGRPAWRKAVDVFVRGGEAPTVVGIDRE